MRFFASLRMTGIYGGRRGVEEVVGGRASNHLLHPSLKTQTTVILSVTK